MWPPKGASFTLLLSRTGAVGFMLFQLVSPDPTCEENETCVNQDEQPLSPWYIWCLMLLSLVTIVSCVVLVCLQCWLKRCYPCPTGRTVAVFAVNDIEFTSGREAVPGPTASVDLHSPHSEMYPVSCIVPFSPPPPYEDTQKTRRL
ncbi:transmembrane protein 207 [Dromiciops gliroides]|uniref:transmembrane protein 207 n=1 Tax=Dromiciops gliroides TaxID=33562 RepID=UPI001CC80E80|nr:transmembrane protein 207 [Dromiciops gliroides]